MDGKKKKSNVPSNPVPIGPPVIKRYDWRFCLEADSTFLFLYLVYVFSISGEFLITTSKKGRLLLKGT